MELRRIGYESACLVLRQYDAVKCVETEIPESEAGSRCNVTAPAPPSEQAVNSLRLLVFRQLLEDFLIGLADEMEDALPHIYR